MVTISVKGYTVHNMSSYKQLSTPPPPLPKSVPAATNWIRQLAEKNTISSYSTSISRHKYYNVCMNLSWIFSLSFRFSFTYVYMYFYF